MAETKAAASTTSNDNDVEVLLPSDKDAQKKDIVLSASSGSPKSLAAKRWTLLRVVTRAGNIMRSSLKKEEQDLLNQLAADNDKDNDDDKSAAEWCGDRQELTDFLDQHNESLPAQEVQYLRQLVASSSVSSDTVKRARQSLVSSKYRPTAASLQELEKLADLDEEAADDDEQDEPAARQKLLQDRPKDASFRREVWDASRKDFEERSKKRLQEKQAAKKAAAEEQAKSQQEKKGGGGFFDFFLGKQEDSEKKQDDERPAWDDDDDDDLIEYTILGTHGDDAECHPHVLTPPIMEQLRPHLPTVVSNDNFWLKYSLARDGASLRALIHHVRNSARTLLAIETMDGAVFGAFCSAPWTPHGSNYFGSGEAFLWRLSQSRFTPCATVHEQVQLESRLSIFPWSGENRNVQRLERPDAQLVIGGGGRDDDGSGNLPEATTEGEGSSDGGSGLVLLPTLETGFSNPCLTFGSPCLPPDDGTEQQQQQQQQQGDFEIANLEVWALTPVDTIDQAEKVELGRRFIFDNSAFVEQ